MRNNPSPLPSFLPAIKITQVIACCCFWSCALTVTGQTTYHWDPNGATSGVGGSGTWTNTGVIWREGSTSGSLVSFHSDANDLVEFSGTGTVTVDADTLVRGIQSSNPGLNFFLSNALNLGGSSSYSSLISGDIDGGVVGINLSNPGSLTLTGNSTSPVYADISAGSLLIGNGGTTGSFQGDITNNALLGFNRSNAYTHNGEISGSGIVDKTGQGTLTLTDAEYSGDTLVQEGTLRAEADGSGNSGLSGLSRYEVLNGATLEVATSAGIGGLQGSGEVVLVGGNTLFVGKAGSSTSFDGTISGSGNVIAQEGASFNLSGAQTFTGVVGSFGAQTVLSFDDDTSFSTSNTIDVDDSAVLFISRTQDLNLQGSLKLSGTLVKEGTGILTFSGTNTLGETGDLEIDRGTLRITGSDGRMFEHVSAEISAPGTLDLANTAQSLGAVAAFENSTLQLGSGHLTLTGGLSADANSSIEGAITGTGGRLTKEGSGSLTLSGNNSYTGDTTLNGGTVVVSGDSSSSTFRVNAGGTLTGTGTVGGLQVNAGGMISPGNSPGTLSAGNTVWGQDGAFLFEIDNATGVSGTDWDLLDITGTLTITATGANPFRIHVDTLINDTATPGAMANFDPDAHYQWILARTSGGILYGAGASVGSSFAIDSGDVANVLNGTLGISQVGNSLALTYTAVPEPQTWMLLGAVLLAFVCTLRRRNPDTCR